MFAFPPKADRRAALLTIFRRVSSLRSDEYGMALPQAKAEPHIKDDLEHLLSLMKMQVIALWLVPYRNAYEFAFVDALDIRERWNWGVARLLWN
jgi:hypothetical protein